MRTGNRILNIVVKEPNYMSSNTKGSVGLTTGLISAFNRIGQEAKGETGQEILANAGMDFKVVKSPLFDSSGNAIKGCGYSRLSRDDTGQTLGVVSNKYQVYQNQQMMDLFETVCQSTGAKIDRIGMVNGGQKVFMSFRQPEGFSFGNGEEIDAYWYMMSSHDASSGLKLFPSPVRLACSNQFGMLNSFLQRNGIDPKTLTIRHSNLMDVRVDQMLDNLNIINHLTENFVKEASGLINIEMNQDERISYYIDVLGLNQNADIMDPKSKDYDATNPYGLGTRANNTIDVLMDLEQSETNNVGDMAGTRWGAFNAVTEYIDHRWTMDKAGKELVANDKRVESAVLGSGMRMKNRAYELLTV